MRDMEALETIRAIMQKLLLVKMDGLNPIPRKGTTKRECYRAIYEIQELLGTRCVHGNFRQLPTVHADDIRAKSDEELARFLGGMGCPEGLSPNSQKCPIPLDYSDEDACYKCWLDWLKKEAINESND